MTVLLSVNVGLPKDVEWQGRTVHTGAWKHPVTGPRMARRLNIDGDGQGDTAGHGGEQRAVLVYQAESYEFWRNHFGRDDLEFGQFGENLTVDGLPDDQVCIGDRYRIGEAEFEVTQPRVTCFRVGLRTGEPELPALLVSKHRPGFYMRVVAEGHIEAGDRIVKTAHGTPSLTVAETDALLYLPGRDPEKLRAATRIPALSPGWRDSFRDLLTGDTGVAAVPVAAEPAWSGFRPLRVTRVVAETETVTSVYLDAPPDGPARAGQYLTLRVAGGVRSYSLSGAPGAYRISVKREPHGTVSSYLSMLRPGVVLDVAAPRGDFVLGDGTGPVLLLSAGIGVTPVLAMLHELAAAGSERDVWWIHGARGPREYALAEEAHALLAALPNAHEHVFWSGTTGRITADTLAALGVPADADAYLCGPAGFITDMRGALTALGVEQVHSELFGALPPINPGVADRTVRPPHQPAGPPGTGPLVTFARSGISTPFPADGRSVLELAEACDVPTRWSCRTGVCHLCVTPLLSGAVAYSPSPLEPPSDGQVLLCCSRPSGDLVLDM
ncbi:MOSC and FAD-binding oxidoreductase domain-containing protein [Pseudonocardia spinosispora]|uniref:MOSC and FAD-binding oxidoreductase domain-containing protein n=1 Tax=Pseudonocardia spinosispora TaxID=103441 RepID=UPI000424262A|nr:MOSC and FAD-binding oxidoreductase domain-containing protein [Pseudonocardia spinosispora]